MHVLEKPNIFVTLGGDLINNATRSSVSNIFEDTMRPSEQKKVMAEMLKPLAKEGRILCAVPGNHEGRSGKDADDDPVYDICAKLDIEHLYRPNIAFVKIQMGKKIGSMPNGTKNPTYTLVVTHGSGGGIYTGAAVNRNERFGYYMDGADALIVGHTHKPFITKPMKLVIDKHNNRVSYKQFVVVSDCAWQRYGGYATKKQLQPQTVAEPQILELERQRKHIGTHW